MATLAYASNLPEYAAPIVLDNGNRFFPGGPDQVDQWFLAEQRKTSGIQHIEVLTPEGDDVDYWDDLLSVLDNRELFVAGLRMIASPFEEPTQFSFKGPLTTQQRHLIHKMSKKNEFKTVTTCEKGTRTLHVFLLKF